MSYESQKLTVYVKFLKNSWIRCHGLFIPISWYFHECEIQNYLYLTSSPVVISWLQNLLLFLRDGQEVFGKKLHHVLIGAIALVSPWLYWAGSSEGWGPTSHMTPQHKLALPANGGYCFLLNASLLYWFLPGYTSLILQLPFPKVTSQVNYLYDKPCLKACHYPLQKRGAIAFIQQTYWMQI